MKRDDLRRARVERSALAALQDGQILWGVERFAFTANNVTYGVFGEQICCWRFFPAPEG